MDFEELELPEHLQRALAEAIGKKLAERPCPHATREALNYKKKMERAETYSEILLQADPTISADTLAIRAFECANRFIDHADIEAEAAAKRIKTHLEQEH